MITSSAQCAVNSSDKDTYLTWSNMKWNVFGNVTAYNVSKKEICKTSDGKTNFFLTGGNLFKMFLAIIGIFLRHLHFHGRVYADMPEVGKLQSSKTNKCPRNGYISSKDC